MDNPIDAIKSLFKTATEPEKKDPGPGDVGPTTQSKNSSGLVTLPMKPAEIQEWFKRIERSTARVKSREKKWEVLLKEYMPIVEASGSPESVKVNMHFRNVHSKIGQLFYRSPDLVLTPKDPGPANNQQPPPIPIIDGPMGPMPAPPITMEDIISVKQQVLTSKLGRDGIKANRLMDQLLFDVLAWSGIGCSKLGYKCAIKNVQQPKMGPPPVQAPPPGLLGIGGLMPPGQVPQAMPQQQVPQLDEMGQPIMETIPVPVYEEYYWRRFSPKKLLLPDDLQSTRYDEDATWVGMHFYMSPKRAMLELGLTEDEAAKSASDDRIFEHQADKAGSDKAPGLVHGYEIWCKANVFTDEVHPQAINQLVLIDGIPDKVFVWRPSPDQEFDEMGKLTQSSLIGFPIRILAIRDFADSPFPEADSAFTNSGIKQLGTWRRQSVLIRDAAIGKYLYDMGAFDEKEIEILKNGDVGAFIGVADGKLAQGANTVFTTTAQVHTAPDDHRAQAMFKQDIEETIGISSVQSGVPESTVRSATETATVASASAGRSDKELGRVVDFYLDGARMIDSLLMKYADQDEYENIVGEDGTQRMMIWNSKVISGRYLYDIAPDSQMREDSAKDFQLGTTLYNLAAADPLFNRAYVLRRLARMRGWDPSKVVLNPATIMAQPPHGGGPVNKHEQSNSGNRPNQPGADNHRENQP